MLCSGAELKDSVRALRRTEAGLLNRLKSIHFDSEWLQEHLLPLLSDTDGARYPVLANLRCGAWYLPPSVFDGSAHYKSTDGHYGTWEFSTSRLNLNVVRAAEQHGAAVVVDSTRKGKVYPDALLRTIPMWCAVINRIKQGCFSAHAKDTDADGTIGTPTFPSNALLPSELPPQLPRSECAQISRKVTGTFVGRATACGVDWDDVGLTLPLKCVHLCRATPPRDVLRTLAACDYTQYRYLFLVSVSAHAELIPRPSFTYVQGAGDDHQTWSCGLSPQMFWEHAEELLETTPIGCEEAAARIVEAQTATGKSSSTVGALAASGEGGDPRVRIEGVGDGYALYISPVCEESDIILGEGPAFDAACDGSGSDEASSGPVRFRVRETSKKDLELALPRLFDVARAKLRTAPNILTVSCATGCGPSVAACVAIIAAMSSSGWRLDFPDGQCAAGGGAVSKQLLRSVLAKVSTYATAAAPSRNLMKQLNRYFVSEGPR